MTRTYLHFPAAVAALIALASISACPVARAEPDSPTQQYISLRHTYPPVEGISLAALAASPVDYAGKTIEVEGVLKGVVENAANNTSILMVDSPRFGMLTLTMTEKPTWVQPGWRFRVLAVVPTPSQGVAGVTLGTPDLVVVAVASAADIAYEEQRCQEQAARRAERERQQRAALAAASAALNRSTTGPNRRYAPTLASRGGEDLSYTPASGGSSSFMHYLSVSAQRIYPAYVGFVHHWNRRLSNSEVDAIASSILIYSEHYGVDPRLVVSLIIAESDFHVAETSNKGAMGLGQLMPDEVHDMGLTNPYDPVQNIGGAVYLLRGRLDHYSTGPGLSMQQIILALASYNAGMGAVKKYGGVPPYRETQNYVNKISRIYAQLCAGDTHQ